MPKAKTEDARMFAPATLHPDAALLNACAEFDRIERELQLNTTANQAAYDRQFDRARAAQTESLNIICSASPVTMAGHAARARTLWLYNGNVDEIAANDRNVQADERLEAAIFRDLMRADIGDDSDLLTAIAAAQESNRRGADGIELTPAEIDASNAVNLRAITVRATTEAGHRARAALYRNAVLPDPDAVADDAGGNGDFYDRLLAALVRDLTADHRDPSGTGQP